MKVIITESQYSRAIDFYISHLLEPHEVKTDEKYPDSIFWIKNGEVIAKIRNSGYFFVESSIWDSISRMFDLDFLETKYVIKMWLEQHPNLGGLTPRYGLSDRP